MDFCKKVVVEYSKRVRDVKAWKATDAVVWIARNRIDIPVEYTNVLC